MFFLAIVGVGTMLAAEMFFDEQWVHGRARVDREGYEGHLGYLFHHHSVVNCVIGILAP